MFTGRCCSHLNSSLREKGLYKCGILPLNINLICLSVNYIEPLRNIREECGIRYKWEGKMLEKWHLTTGDDT